MKTQKEVLTTINKVVRDLSENQILQRLPGNCILAADLVQNMLYSEGVNSRPVEVQVIFSKVNEQGDKFTHLLGYDNKFHTPYQHDTHVVVVTETDPPYLIDTSIGNILGNLEAVVIKEIEESKNDLLCETVIEGCSVIYRVKKNIKLPFFHQRDVVDKLKQTVKIQRTLSFLKWFVIVAAGIGIINFIMNVSLLTLKLFGS